VDETEHVSNLVDQDLTTSSKGKTVTTVGLLISPKSGKIAGHAIYTNPPCYGCLAKYKIPIVVRIEVSHGNSKIGDRILREFFW
jgi:hypothetical protein